MSNTVPTFIDLFSGCGGFSLGLKWAGFSELAAIDFNPEAVLVFKANFPDLAITNLVLQENLLSYQPSELEKLIGKTEVDLIVGGPPCQGFSKVRQRDGSNSGDRIVDDDRRELYQEFLKYVKHFRPKIFIMENVLGIRSAAGGHFFNRVQSEARDLGYRVHGEVIRAWEYGVPQKRERQLIIGTQLGLPLFSRQLYIQATHGNGAAINQQELVTLGEAIGDLPPIEAGTGKEVTTYDADLRQKHIEKYTGRYLLDVLQVDKSPKLTGHRARPHSERDLRDFERLYEGETCAHAIARGVHMEFPYNKETFKDRYTRQDRNSLCSTIVAHLSKDGLMFIHPTQNRSLTPREAARIQSFPDWFAFPVARTHQYRLIGNAVPPLVGKAVGLGIKQWLKATETHTQNHSSVINKIDASVARDWLMSLVSTNGNGRLARMSSDQFKNGWSAIAYFYYHLHPDSAQENGQITNLEGLFNHPYLEGLDERLIRPIYERSGWPVFLAIFAQEAYRRLLRNELTLEEYYCSDIHILGFHHHRGFRK